MIGSVAPGSRPPSSFRLDPRSGMDGGGAGGGGGGGDGTVRLGALSFRPDRALDLAQDVGVSSPVTRQKAAAAKQFIENHYKNYLQGLQDRKDRFGDLPPRVRPFSDPRLILRFVRFLRRFASTDRVGFRLRDRPRPTAVGSGVDRIFFSVSLLAVLTGLCSD